MIWLAGAAQVVVNHGFGGITVVQAPEVHTGNVIEKANVFAAFEVCRNNIRVEDG